VAVAAATTFTIVVVAYLSFPVTGIQVEGARMYPESDVWDTVPDHASLLTLDEESLEREVKSNSWVKGARVSKNWESGIVTVEVEERRPVLDAEVDGRRVIRGVRWRGASRARWSRASGGWSWIGIRWGRSWRSSEC
jgi:cell division septal protein FtsQ